jgi:hypothetical protein
MCKLAAPRFAPIRCALLRFAPRRFAPLRFARCRFASCRSAPRRFAPFRFVRSRSAGLSSALRRFAWLRSGYGGAPSSRRHAFQAATPCLSRAMCSLSATAVTLGIVGLSDNGISGGGGKVVTASSVPRRGRPYQSRRIPVICHSFARLRSQTAARAGWRECLLYGRRWCDRRFGEMRGCYARGQFMNLKPGCASSEDNWHSSGVQIWSGRSQTSLALCVSRFPVTKLSLNSLVKCSTKNAYFSFFPTTRERFCVFRALVEWMFGATGDIVATQ